MKRQLRRYLPLGLSLCLIVLLVSYAPWRDVGRILAHLNPLTVVLLVTLSLVYYGLKAARFWYILQAIGIRRPFGVVAASYMSAQPLTLLPAGELFRSHTLRQFTGIPVKRSSPQFLIQGLLEGCAMAVLLVASALNLGTLRLPAVIFIAVLAGCLIGIRQGYLARAGKLLNHLPFLDMSERSIEQFSRRNKRVLSRRWLPMLLALSLMIEVTGSAIAFAAVKGVHGDIEVFEAAIIYSVPIIAGFVSFLPGGIGISEQAAIGVLLLDHNSVGKAVAGTLLMRSSIVLLGVIYGFGVALFARIRFTPQAQTFQTE